MSLPKSEQERTALLDRAIVLYAEEGELIKNIPGLLGITRYDLQELTSGNERWVRAREIRAEGLAEEGLEIVDNADPVTATLARAQAQYRQWLASMYGPRTFSPKQQLEVKGEIAVTPVINIQLPAPDTEHVQLIENKEIEEKE